MTIDETTLNIAEQERLNKLIDEGKSKAEALLQLAKERNESLKDTNELLSDNIKKNQVRIDLLRQANEEAKTGYETRERSRELAVLETKQHADTLQLLMNKVFEGRELNKQEKELYEQMGSNYKKLAQTLTATKGLAKAREEVNDLVRTETGFQSAINNALAKAVALSENRNMLAVGHKKLLGGIEGMMTSLWKSAKDAMFGMDQAISDFNKTFQLGDQYSDQIRSTYTEMNHLGVSIEDASKSTQDLIRNVSDFTMMSGEQQRSLTNTVARFNELGVSTDVSTKIMQSSLKMFGESTATMDSRIGELAASARALGVDQETYFNQLQQHSGALAKFGTEAIDTFKDLQHVQKITGMEMEKVLAITNKFDTFEGAAEQAGKLNAALGGNMVNAMDLMMETDPVGRFEQIRDSMLDSGLAFDDMSYYQKQYFTQALGLSDVGDLAVMLSGDLNDLAGAGNESAESIIEQKERMAETQSIMETYKNLIADIGGALIPVAETLNRWTTALAENAVVVKTLFWLLVGWRALMITHNTLAAIGALRTALSTTGIWKRIIAKKAETLAEAEGVVVKEIENELLEENTDQLDNNTSSMSSSIGVMLAFGAAILMVGAGVFLAASGFALLADSIKGMTDTELQAFTDTLLVFGAGLVVLMLALGLLVYSGVGVAAAGLMLAFGQAIALVGVGVFLAAAGIALMAHSLGAAMENIDPVKLDAFGAFVLTMGTGVAFLVLGAYGLVLFAVGVAALGLSLALVSEKKLQNIADLTVSLAELSETAHLDETASAIERIAGAVDKVGSLKSFALKAAIDAVGTAALDMKAAGVFGTLAAGETNATAALPEKIFFEAEVPINIHIGDEKLDTIFETWRGRRIGEANR